MQVTACGCGEIQSPRQQDMIIRIKQGMGTWAIVQWGEDGQDGQSPRDSCRSHWRMRRPQNKYQHWNGYIDCKDKEPRDFFFGTLPWRHPALAFIMLSTMGARCAMGNLGTSWWGKSSLTVWLWCKQWVKWVAVNSLELFSAKGLQSQNLVWLECEWFLDG